MYGQQPAIHLELDTSARIWTQGLWFRGLDLWPLDQLAVRNKRLELCLYLWSYLPLKIIISSKMSIGTTIPVPIDYRPTVLVHEVRAKCYVGTYGKVDKHARAFEVWGERRECFWYQISLRLTIPIWNVIFDITSVYLNRGISEDKRKFRRCHQSKTFATLSELTLLWPMRFL
jgi:hypothetical protein